MAELTIRRGAGGNLALNDPFQMVRESMRRMQDLFREPMFEPDPLAILEAGRMMAFTPDFEVRETKDGLLFRADLPGVKEDDVEVTVLGNRLRISGRRELEQESRGDTWYAAERSYGSFTRNFALPEGCDTNDVAANLTDGVLTVRLGKRQEAQPRRIAIGRQGAIEGYSQGPFHQSAHAPGAEAGACGAGANIGAPGANVPAAGPGGAGQGGYGGMYGGNAPEAGANREYGAAAGGFEHGAQAGGAAPARRPADEPPER